MDGWMAVLCALLRAGSHPWDSQRHAGHAWKATFLQMSSAPLESALRQQG